ncbi:MAG: NAD-dependent epimerase/dehydratase family protein [Acidimicrobiales bacterium]
MATTDCLVTGGSGFIGQRLVAHLQRSGRFRRVVNLDIAAEPGQGHAVDVRRPITLVPGDHRFEVCIHLAALAKEPGYDHHEYYAVNDEGTGHVLDLCGRLGISSVIFTSTMMVFAAGEHRRSEVDAVDPDTAYGGSKALAEQRIRTWAAADQQRRIRIVRPGVVFGPGDEGNFERLRRILDRKVFFYVGGRQTVKSCVHLDDVVRHIEYLVDDTDPHDLVHCAIPEPTTIEEIVDGMFDAFGGRYRVPTVPFRAAHVAARPFEWLARAGYDSGVHRRRIEKLHHSTNISADRMAASCFELHYPTVGEGVAAWAAEGA